MQGALSARCAKRLAMNHMAVWMDGGEAKVFHVEAEHFDEAKVNSPKHHIHRHPKHEQSGGHGHADDAVHFFRDVAHALAEATEILVVGPSVTKLQFSRYLHKNNPALEARIVGLETVDHPTDRQLVAYVRTYFHLAAPRTGT